MDKNYKNGYTSNVLSEKTVQVTLNIKLLNFIIKVGHTSVKDMCHFKNMSCTCDGLYLEHIFFFKPEAFSS